MMKAPQRLHELGQSLWLDNITRDLLDSGTLERYIKEFSVTGLTSNPTIFDHALKVHAGTDNHNREITGPECPDLRQIGQCLCLGPFPGRHLEDRAQRRYADGLVCADQPRPERSTWQGR